METKEYKPKDTRILEPENTQVLKAKKDYFIEPEETQELKRKLKTKKRKTNK